MDDLQLAIRAATDAARIIREMFGRRIAAELKSAVNPVTVADTAAEAAIIETIRHNRPTDSILAEESGADGQPGSRTWIIDPLDGTVNFIHDVPQVAVSIALWEDDSPRVGVVLDVMREDVYAATLGGGATCNGRQLRVSDRTVLSEMLVSTGFPYDRDTRAELYLRWVSGVLPRVRGLRRAGSAALDIAYVAAGRFDAHFEVGIQPWDVAAGLLLVAEAGGRSITLAGRPASPASGGFIISSGADDLERLIRSAIPAELLGR